MIFHKSYYDFYFFPLSFSAKIQFNLFTLWPHQSFFMCGPCAYTFAGQKKPIWLFSSLPFFGVENEDICYCWWQEHWIFPSLVWHKFCLWRVKKELFVVAELSTKLKQLRRSNEDYFTLRNLKKGVSRALMTENLHFRVPKCRSPGLFNYKSPLFLNWTLKLLKP